MKSCRQGVVPCSGPVLCCNWANFALRLAPSRSSRPLNDSWIVLVESAMPVRLGGCWVFGLIVLLSLLPSAFGLERRVSARGCDFCLDLYCEWESYRFLLLVLLL